MKSDINLLNDDVWSDDEADYLENIATKQNLSHGISLQHSEVNSSQGDMYKKKKKLFSGEVRAPSLLTGRNGCESSSLGDKGNEESNTSSTIALPHVPAHVKEVLGTDVVQLLWHQFLLHDSDESELVLTCHLTEIHQNMSNMGHNLPFDEVDIDPDGNEYTDFSYVIDKLAVKRNRAGVIKPVHEYRAQLPPCCATNACFVHSRAEKKVFDEGDERPDFRLDVIYRRWILDKRGIVRVNDVPSILAEADIDHDMTNLPPSYWIVHGDELLINFEVLVKVASQIRLDTDDEVNQLDLYRLPRWLMNEFIPEEVAMFRHHFMMIDVDRGGSIDAEELQFLGESLGNKLSLEEAERLIAEHDDDNSGTIDFAEFMGLMFKILRGTVDVENDKLGKAMMESRSQIKLFQEIENIKGCRIHTIVINIELWFLLVIIIIIIIIIIINFYYYSYQALILLNFFLILLHRVPAG
jgi:troponin C